MRSAVAIACFFLSGAAGLIYEVCWIRRASLVFGSTIFAVSTVLAVFFLGLAAGSYVFGRVTRGAARPMRIYVLLELGLAAAALATLPAFGLAETLYGHAYRAFGAAPGPLWAARVVLVALILFPPTFLMGGTLPLFCRQFVRSGSRIAGSVGALYAVNTLGAAAGCAAAGFVLIPALGVGAAVALGAALNLVAGVAVAALRFGPPPAVPAPSRKPRPAAARGHAAVAALVFVAGFVALGNEVLWTRFLALLVRNTVTTYTLTLTVVLVGIVLGSLAASRAFDRPLPRGAILGGLQILLAIAALAPLMLPPAAWARLGEGLPVYFALLLPSAVISGATFPLAVRMVVEDPSLAGLGVGRMAAINTLGGILGSLAVGFVALPALGLHASALAVTGASLAAGSAAWLALDRGRRRWPRLAAIAVGAVVWLAIPRATGARIPADFLDNGGILVAHREGLQSNLAVVRRPTSLDLEIDRWWQGRDRKTHQIVAAHLPMLIHPAPRRVVVVGVGAGQTPERFLLYDIDRLDCVDIEPAVFDLIRAHFPSAWMADPRVELIRADGRNVLTHTAARYDVVSIEVGQIFRPGVGSFYTADFYRRVRSRLAPGGLVSQFVPLTFLSAEEFRGVVRTFLDVFPESALWYNTAELLLIGTSGGRLEIDPERLRLLESDPRIAADLRYAHWDGPAYWLARPAVLLGGFLCGPAGLDRLSAGGAVYGDDRPVLEYATVGADRMQATELPALDLLRAHLAPVAAAVRGGLPADSARLAEAVRERNLGDVVAGAWLRRAAVLGPADPQAALQLAAGALRANPESAEGMLVLGDALLLLGREPEAEERFIRLLAMRPDDARARRGLGVALHRQGRVAEAIPHYRAALAGGLEDAEIHNNLGAALGEGGDLDGAARHFRRALELRPGFPGALANLQRLGAARGGPPRPPRR